MDKDKLLPHNNESERIVIGSILTDINAYSEVSVIISPEMFYNPFHKELYENIKELGDQGKAPDIVMLAEKYKGNHEAVLQIADISGYFSVDYYDHALNIQEKYVRRKLWQIGQQVSGDVFGQKETNELIYSMQKELEGIGERVAASEVHTLKDAISGVYKQIESNLKGEHITGTDTGFSEINKASGGLQKSDLVIIAGATSQGKTSLALALADTAAKSGEGVAIYSMEMKKEQCAARLLSMNSGVPANEILFSKLDSNYIEIIDSQGSAGPRPSSRELTARALDPPPPLPTHVDRHTGTATPPSDPIPANARKYRVKRNDTLWSIAQKLYGDASRNRDIRNANRGRLGPNDTLIEGTDLIIPMP